MLPLSKKFVPERYSFTLPILKPLIPEKIRQAAKEHGLAEKVEVHLSVAVAKNARLIKEAVEKRGISKGKLEEVISLFDSFVWEYSLTEEYFFHERFYTKEYLHENGYADLTEHTRRSIVQKALLPDLNLFYSKLNASLGVELSVPAPHATLFTWADQPQFASIGIGVSSAKEFEENIREAL